MTIKAFKITPEADIPIDSNASTLDGMTRELSEGYYTTFTTLAQGTRVLGLQAHLHRIYSPANEHGITPAVNETCLRKRLARLVKENLPKESRVRLVLTKEAGEIYIGIQPFEPLPVSVYSKGVRVITSEISRKDPRIKDTAFISESILQRNLLKRELFEILLVRNGQILEGMTSNFYAIKGKRLVTARQGILLGVTRKAILRLAKGLGMSIEYRPPRVKEKFDEAFLTSSSRGVVPIVSIDDVPVGEGGVGAWAKALSKAYQDYVRERSESLIDI